MDSSALKRRLEEHKKLEFGTYPTPLEPLPNLSSALKGPGLWVKRDDGLGPGMGGNKTRNLEYIMADVISKGKQKVATFGGVQSNHCRITAAICQSLALEAHIFHFEKQPEVTEGNLLLTRLSGAKMHFIAMGAGGNGSMTGSMTASLTLEMTNRLVKMLSLLYTGPRAYFIPAGGHTVIGCLGYVQAALELQDQVRGLDLDERAVTIVTATGTGGTLAGLLAGFTLLDSPIRVLGIDIGKLWKAFPATIARMVNALGATLGTSLNYGPADIPLIEEKYVGSAYAEITAESLQAIETVAQSEDILLDPIYTGKAFAGLLDLIKRGHFADDEQIIFLHTGGAPGLWVQGDDASK